MIGGIGLPPRMPPKQSLKPLVGKKPPFGSKKPLIAQKPPMLKRPPVGTQAGRMTDLSNKRPRDDTGSHYPAKRPSYGSGSQPARQGGSSPQLNRPNKRGYNELNERSS